MQSLAEGALRVMRGEESVNDYPEQEASLGTETL
jgi:butyrate kinase